MRIQSDRGQYVVASGPYAYVRHPGYLAGIVIMLASGLALGSWLAALLVIVSSLPFLLYRAVSEDRVLQAELPVPTMRAASAGAWCPAFGEAEQGFASPSRSTSLRQFA